MHCLEKIVGVSVLSVTCGLLLSTVAFSLEQEVYDKHKVEEPERTIHGKVVKVVKRDAAVPTWDVSVENKETGEKVSIYLDKKTARKVTATDPIVGDMVVVSTMSAVSTPLRLWQWRQRLTDTRRSFSSRR